MLKIQPGDHLNSLVQVAAAGGGLGYSDGGGRGAAESKRRGKTLRAGKSPALPLNKRDFSQLLLLAAGTMTDTNGSANFTQQFAVNGQRGATPCLPWTAWT